MVTGRQVVRRAVTVRRAVGRAGLVLHLVVGLVPFALTATVAAGWAAIVLGMWWVALVGVALRTYRARPLFTPLVPAISVVMWVGVVVAAAPG